MNDQTAPERGSEPDAPEPALLRALAARVERDAALVNPHTLAHGALARTGELRRRRRLTMVTAVSMVVLAVVVVTGGWGRLAASRWAPAPPAHQPLVAPSPLFDSGAQARLGLPPLTAAQVEAELNRLPVTHATSRSQQAADDLGVRLRASAADHAARLAGGRTVSLGKGTIVYAETTHDKAYGAVYIVDAEGVDPNTQGMWAGHRVVVVDLATGKVHQRPLAGGGGIPFFWTSHTLVLTGRAPTPPSASRTVAATPTSTTDPDPSAFEERERTLLWSFPEGAVREGPIGRPLAAAATGDRFVVRNFDDGPGKAESDKSVVYRVHDLGTLQVVAWFWEPLSRATDFDPLLSDDGRTWIREDLPIPRAVQSQGPAPALPSWLRPKNVTQMVMGSDGRYVFIVGTGRRGEPDVRAVGVLACDPAVPAGAEMPCERVALEGEWVGWLRSLNGEG